MKRSAEVGNENENENENKQENKKIKVEIKHEEDDEDIDNSDAEEGESNRKAVNFVKKEGVKKCPYLDTVNRQLLDFDMEKVCSISLSNLNVYCCLICGKYFQGRGKNTPAYTHSVAAGHFVFMHLHDVRTFCLPDGYEVLDQSLVDVKNCVSPQFDTQDIQNLNKNSSLARDVYGVNYLPGFVGLNNLKNTDYVNVILHALSHVTPIRDFFLNSKNYENSKSVLVHKFGDVVRKLWSRYNFKSIVSPQDLLQEISVASHKRFNIGVQAEAADLLTWLLAGLHKGLGGSAKKPSVVTNSFGGLVEVTTMTKTGSSAQTLGKGQEGGMDTLGREIRPGQEGWSEVTTTTPFTLLSLEIPPTPLFRDSEGGLIIPQIPLFQILKKFDGQTWTDQISVNTHTRKKYVIRKLPHYLILHLVRFTKNNFLNLEKNRSVITFPVKNLSLKDYHFPADTNGSSSGSASASSSGSEPPIDADVNNMSVKQLKEVVIEWGCEAHRTDMVGMIEKEVLVSLAKTASEWARNMNEQISLAKYDLVANICHDSSGAQELTVKAGHSTGQSNAAAKAAATAKALAAGKTPGGSYRCHTQNKATGQWFELQDLHVTETMPQLIGLSEAYILIYERKGTASI
mmetsp:Transcript_28280/g.27113  ORF Transcript_28280/g.27113 Transcript_28280/m.27113 type:complete len:627 (+) Transcript_28280:162-2042(+)|eukprot:CAMPEP_0119039646 /NCGR_PEP_ID=MMETSP1177-20130426/9262_1 /TAXON_ID=2985 /ORGANISM="Ochromonas sp, Strain CCMP1899" /LENGTH=626 /DNA_ID=CAMNT_0007003807 /DNA_START=61 /DNA_END=1941 /DNA_ORIENTATION=+